MYYKQIFMNDMGSLSYLIGCTKTNTACVINPQKNISEYIDAAIRHKLKITHIFETYGHVAQLSGKLELKSLTDAEIYYLDEHDDKYRKNTVREGDEFEIGNALLTIINSPAHTPFANSIIVTDRENRSEPWVVTTRESIFIGDIVNSAIPGNKLSEKVTGYMNFYETDDQPWPVRDLSFNEKMSNQGIDMADTLPVV